MQADAHGVILYPGHAGVYLAWARSWTRHSMGAARGRRDAAVQTGRVRLISVTSEALGRPTVTVLVTGSMSST